MDDMIPRFWSENFWLPGQVTFEDLKSTSNFRFPAVKDIFVMLSFGIGIYIVRTVFEKVVATPLAEKLDIIDKRKKPIENHILEKNYEKEKLPSPGLILELAKSLNWKERAISNWFRRRRNMDRPSLFKKFAEASWRFFFYIFAFTFGMYVLVRAPWFWDNSLCWKDYPRQSLRTTVYLYYMLEGGFYMSLLFTVMSDVKRKDFSEQLIHHTATIFLIVFSYIVNYVRIGTIVMAVHDISDIFLEAAKCMHYGNKHTYSQNTFTVFAVVFIISRIFIYPFYVIHTALIKFRLFLDPHPAYYFFNALLIVLLFLHIFWAGIIVKMAIRLLRDGDLENDARSDVEEATSDEDETARKSKTKKTN